MINSYLFLFIINAFFFHQVIELKSTFNIFFDLINFYIREFSWNTLNPSPIYIFFILIYQPTVFLMQILFLTNIFYATIIYLTIFSTYSINLVTPISIFLSFISLFTIIFITLFIIIFISFFPFSFFLFLIFNSIFLFFFIHITNLSYSCSIIQFIITILIFTIISTIVLYHPIDYLPIYFIFTLIL